MTHTTRIGLNRRQLIATGAATLAMPMLITRPALAVTPAEIRSRGKVIIGIQGDNPPWGFVNSAGKQEGLDADISELFSKELGVPAKAVGARKVSEAISKMRTSLVSLEPTAKSFVEGERITKRGPITGRPGNGGLTPRGRRRTGARGSSSVAMARTSSPQQAT